MSSVQIFLLTIATMYGAANAIDTMRIFDVDVEVPKTCWDLLNRGTDKKGDSHANFCNEEPSNYPTEHVNNYVNEMYRNDNIHFDIKPDDAPAYRANSCDGERNKNCCSSSTTTTPYFIRSESMLKLVLQTSYFTQRLKTTKCLNEGVDCFEDFYFNESAKQLKTGCKTNMGSTKVYVFNPATNKTEIVSAVFPVSCSCHVNKKKHY